MPNAVTSKELLKRYANLLTDEYHHQQMNDRPPIVPYPQADRLTELQAAILTRMDVNESFNKVPLPETVEQAELMEKVGYAYLKEHAPERLAPLELRDPPLGMFAVVNGEECIWDGEDWAPARILKHRLPMKLTPEMVNEIDGYVMVHSASGLWDGSAQELWDRALEAWMKWPPETGPGEAAPVQDPGREQALLNFVAEQVDERWRAKNGINCTEVCAIIRGALTLAAPIRLTPTLTVDPLTPGRAADGGCDCCVDIRRAERELADLQPESDYLSTAEPFGYVYEERLPVRFTFTRHRSVSPDDLAEFEVAEYPVYLKPQDEPTFDATDGAHPAWWRGEQHGTDAAVKAFERMLDGEVTGTFGHPGLERLRKRIMAFTLTVEKFLGMNK